MDNRTDPEPAAARVVSDSSMKSDNDFIILPSLTVPKLSEPTEYLVLINYEAYPMHDVQIKRAGILSVTLSDTHEELINKIKALRAQKLFDVHEAGIGTGTPYLAAAWGSAGDLQPEKGRKKVFQSVVRNDEELKLCLGLMKQRGWKDWFVVQMA